MSEILIFENEHGYYWVENFDGIESEIEYYGEDEFRYILDNTGLFYHQCVRSGLYDDMTGYVDQLQHEEELTDDELYVVYYYKLDSNCYILDQLVDFGLTKQEIIKNVLDQKYVEGANYVTMGKMFYHTKMYLDGK